MHQVIYMCLTIMDTKLSVYCITTAGYYK